MFQDNLFNADKSGEKQIQATSYQVTTTELELWTGLDFPKNLYDANPLKFYANKSLNIDGPESIELPPLQEDGTPTESVVFERGDIQNAQIIKRRKTMKQEDFYQFIEDISWV